MTAFEAFDVVLVPFPFSDLSTRKRRPALVLASVSQRRAGRLLAVAMITSQVESENLPGDCLIESWKEAGLLHPSKIRFAKVVTLESSVVVKKLGRLEKKERKKTLAAFGKVFDAWI